MRNEYKRKNISIRYYPYHITKELRKKGKENIHSKFKTNFAYVCSFCNKNKLTSGYVIGIPATTDMLDMLVAISPDKIINHLVTLRKVYNYLSTDFVHFSTSVRMDSKPKPHNILGKTITVWGFVGKTITVWGFEGVRFCLEVLKPLAEYYFLKLRESRRNKRKSALLD